MFNLHLLVVECLSSDVMGPVALTAKTSLKS